MDRKVIVFVTNNYTPYAGGVVSSIKAFSRYLRRMGHVVHIVTLDFKHAPHEKGVIRLYCPLKFTYKNNPMAVPWKMRKTLEHILRELRPDIIHTHHPFFLGSAAQKIGKRLGIPVYFTHHTQYDCYLHYVPFPKKFAQPMVNSIVSRYCEKVDHIVAPSQSIKDTLALKHVDKDILVIPSPLLPIFEKSVGTFESKKVKEKWTLLFVGRFTQEKNIEALIDLMVLLDERFVLQLVGYGYHQQVLKNYSVNKGLGKRVYFIHKPSRKRLCSLYRDADIFVFSSQSETQGIVLAEAMAVGTPVISFRGPGQNDIIVDGGNGYLVNSIYEMRDKILLLYHDAGIFCHLQEGAVDTAKKYTSAVVVQQLLHYYDFCKKGTFNT